MIDDLRKRFANVAVCDDCWVAREGDRVPVRFKEPPSEPCHFCDKITLSGIYQRVKLCC